MRNKLGRICNVLDHMNGLNPHVQSTAMNHERICEMIKSQILFLWLI